MKKNLVLVGLVVFFVSCGNTKAPKLVDKDSSNANTEKGDKNSPNTNTDKSPASHDEPSREVELIKLQNKAKLKVDKGDGDSFTFTNTEDGKSITSKLTCNPQAIAVFENLFIAVQYRRVNAKKEVRFGYGVKETVTSVNDPHNFTIVDLCSSGRVLEIKKGDDPLFGKIVEFGLVNS